MCSKYWNVHRKHFDSKNITGNIAGLIKYKSFFEMDTKMVGNAGDIKLISFIEAFVELLVQKKLMDKSKKDDLLSSLYELYSGSQDKSILIKNLKDIVSEFNIFRLDLSGKSIESANFSNLDLSGCNLSDIHLVGADLQNINLDYSDLTNANLTQSNLKNAKFHNAKLSKVNLRGSFLLNAEFQYANLRDSRLGGVRAHRANFFQSDLTNARIRGADLSLANFSYANLTGVHFENSDLTGTNFKHANLKETNFEGAINLTLPQITDAITDGTTFPSYLKFE